MVDNSLRRRVVVLVPRADANAVLANGTGLGEVDCALDQGQSTIEGVAATLAALGLHGAMLECVIDQTSPNELDGRPRPALIQMGPPPLDWTPPAGWVWLAWDALDTTQNQLRPELEVVARTRVAELRGLASVPELRAAWSQPGWYEQASEWIADSLRSTGRAAPDSITQVRHWGISALMRVDASDGPTWFKATFPHFRSEVPISALLARLAPGATGAVVAADEHNGWILLEQFAGVTDETDPETTRRAVDHLVRLEHDMLAHEAALLAAGCERRPLHELAADLQVSLNAEVVTAQLGLTAARAHQLVAAVAEAAAAVEAVGLPDTLLHGDFHPGNVAVGDDNVVLFDWSDGAIGSPVIETAVWGWWYDDDELQLAQLWGIFCTAWQREFGVDASGLSRADVDIVAGAYHLISYERILTALEPTERPSHADGLDHFYQLLARGIDGPPAPQLAEDE